MCCSEEPALDTQGSSSPRHPLEVVERPRGHAEREDEEDMHERPSVYFRRETLSFYPPDPNLKTIQFHPNTPAHTVPWPVVEGALSSHFSASPCLSPVLLLLCHRADAGWSLCSSSNACMPNPACSLTLSPVSPPWVVMDSSNSAYSFLDFQGHLLLCIFLM